MNYTSLSYLKSLSKSELGTIGENLVQKILTEKGYVVVNANSIHHDYKSIDLICTNPETNKSAGIQVKTSFNNIPIGLNLANCFREVLEKKILGPWVFVHINENGVFHAYVLSREEMIALTHESNDWYINKWKSSYRKKPVKLTNACGLEVRWLQGGANSGEVENERHYSFDNPLKEFTEDRWDKIDQILKHNTLAHALQSFTGVTEVNDIHKKYESLTEQFSRLAKEIFFGGYFDVNGKRRIFPLEIEFYYHEEGENGLKDPIMYHTSDHERKDIPYYPPGTLNFHVSGLDVSFENEEKRYRASFLIRSYQVQEFDGKAWNIKKDKECEHRSTYIYEDMLECPIDKGIHINWISKQQKISNNWKPEINKRINVSAYKADHNGLFVKDKNGYFVKDEITASEYIDLSQEQQQEYFSYSGKKYRHCSRKWNFKKYAHI